MPRPLTPSRTRTARPKRMHRGPHTRLALGAALALHARAVLPLADEMCKSVFTAHLRTLKASYL